MFRGKLLHPSSGLILKMYEAGFFSVSVLIYQIKWRHVLGDIVIILTHHLENLK
jgi:hypothetical protein